MPAQLQAAVKSKLGRPKKIHIDPDQPGWVCYKCGKKYGSFRCGLATWHQDHCGVCGEWQSCTEPRDFGYLLLGWKDKRNAGHDDEAVSD